MTDPVDCEQLLIDTEAICELFGRSSPECESAWAIYNALCGASAGSQTQEELKTLIASGEKLLEVLTDEDQILSINRSIVRLQNRLE